MSETVTIHRTPSIFDEVKSMQDRIVQRAYEIFERTGSLDGRELDNWLTAEREFVWKPPVELREKDHEFQLQVAVPGVDPHDIDIEVTPEDLLLKADLSHEHKEEKGIVHICEFECGKMFRSIHLPKKIDPEKVNAEFKNGMLRITAEIAAEARVERLDQKQPLERWRKCQDSGPPARQAAAVPPLKGNRFVRYRDPMR